MPDEHQSIWKDEYNQMDTFGYGLRFSMYCSVNNYGKTGTVLRSRHMLNASWLLTTSWQRTHPHSHNGNTGFDSLMKMFCQQKIKSLALLFTFSNLTQAFVQAACRCCEDI